MAQELSRYLTSLDSAFLYFEKPTESMHIGSCMVYEGRMEKSELTSLLAERVHLTPRYRQRVVFPPLSANHPFWIDDPDFDVDEHVEVVELEGVVGERELAEAVAEAYSGSLPRNRPLWSATLLHGLPGDNTAIVWRVHHAMIDGVSGVDLTMALNGFTPDEQPVPPPEVPWAPDPLPDPYSLMQEAVRERLANVSRAWTDVMFDGLRPDQVARRWQRMTEAAGPTLPKVARPAPKTRFNKRVSGKMGYAWRELSFTEVRQVKGALGGTVNDLVLAILSGGVGRYLRAKGDKTDGLELRAMCPVSMRQQDERGQLGNLVSVMIAPLFVGIEDPIERHRAGIEAMVRNKEAKQAEALYELTQFSELVPPGFQAMAGRVPIPPTLFNTVSTNVPGPNIPLYQAGRKCLAWLPLGIVSSGIGLFTAILTYNRKITLGTTVDAAQIPDPWLLSECIRDSYEELRDLAEVRPVAFDTFQLAETTHPNSRVAAETPEAKERPARRAAKATAGRKKAAAKKKTASKKTRASSSKRSPSPRKSRSKATKKSSSSK